MGEAWRIGIAAGLGVAIGLLAATLAPGRRGSLVAAVVVGAAVGAGVGYVVDNWDEAVAGAIGGLAGAFGAWPVVRGALGRGGTRGGTIALLAGAAIVLAALAFVPVLGYLEALALPALGLRARRRGGDRYAGLRVLARD